MYLFHMNAPLAGRAVCWFGAAGSGTHELLQNSKTTSAVKNIDCAQHAQLAASPRMMPAITMPPPLRAFFPRLEHCHYSFPYQPIKLTLSRRAWAGYTGLSIPSSFRIVLPRQVIKV